MDESELIGLAKDGDEEAFAALVRGRYQRMYWIAYQVVGNAEEAKDVVQTAFIRLWKALDKYDPRFTFSTWLHRMVMNLAIDHLRRESRHRHAEEPDEERTVVPEARGGASTPAAALADAELQAVFDRLASGLAPQQRAAFVLREVEDLSTEEVAEILGVTASTVRNHVFQARKVLREELTRRYPEYVPRGRKAAPGE
jgi:RNA polymerase sigma-70 factor (ECF subfamily)